MKALPVAVLGAACALLASASAQAQQRRYTYVPVGSFATHTSGWSAARDVNAAGQLAGEANVGTLGYARAIRVERRAAHEPRRARRGGRASPGASTTRATSSGRRTRSRYEPSHLFLYRDGRMTDLGTGLGSGSVELRPRDQRRRLDRRRPQSGRRRTQRGFVWRNGAFDRPRRAGWHQAGACNVTDHAPRTSTTAARSSAAPCPRRATRCTRTCGRTARCATSASSGPTPRRRRRSRSTTTARSRAGAGAVAGDAGLRLGGRADAAARRRSATTAAARPTSTTAARSSATRRARQPAGHAGTRSCGRTGRCTTSTTS